MINRSPIQVIGARLSTTHWLRLLLCHCTMFHPLTSDDRRKTFSRHFTSSTHSAITSRDQLVFVFHHRRQ